MPPRSVIKSLKSLSEAIDSEDNELVSMCYPQLRGQFFDLIESQKVELEALIRQLLQVNWCRVTPSEIWQSGSFNVAIPVCLPFGTDVYLRLPLPYRIGEGTFPGNAEEKIRTEAATYIWLQENCPDVPIPKLYAFGLPDGSIFTSPENTAWWRRVWWRCKYLHAFILGRPTPITHVRHSIRHQLPSGFLLLSEAQGQTLTLSWPMHCHDRSHRENLFRGLARIALSMNSVPQPRIGSFCLQADDTIALSNRPLDLHIHMAENEGVPSGIPRQRTYAEVDPYVSDLLSLQDSKLQKQPNAIFDVEDGQRQMAVMHHFINSQSRHGPFYMTLSDLNRNNIFVDEHWNIKTIIDLEWAYTLPAEMQRPPYWLTSRPVDGFYELTDRQEYEKVLEEYLAIYEEEEIRRKRSIKETTIQRQSWRNGGFWFYNAVVVPKAKYNLFNWHIQPLFNKEHPDELIFDEVFHCYWGIKATATIDKKVEERKAYIDEVTKAHQILKEKM